MSDATKVTTLPMPMRRLLERGLLVIATAALAATGLVAVHDLAGSPFARTWPMRGWHVPPLARLDHVLVRDVGVRAVREGEPVSSDHAPIVADLVVANGR